MFEYPIVVNHNILVCYSLVICTFTLDSFRMYFLFFFFFKTLLGAILKMLQTDSLSVHEPIHEFNELLHVGPSFF